MWYDKYPGVPPRGSPLETLFVLVQLQRREAELLATKALVLSSMAESNEETKNVISSFKLYCDTMFPFMERAGDMEDEKHKARLLEFVKRPMMIDVASLRRERVEAAKKKGLERYKVRQVEIPGIKPRK